MIFYIYIILAYLLGSIPFGKIVGLFYGIDIQKQGSGNIGFSNCYRILGWKPALLVLAGDMLKGFVPVCLALRAVSLNESMIIALAAIFGHIFPVWLKFHGGKGVATVVGATLAFNIYAGLASMMLWYIILLFSKKGSVASLVMMSFLPIIFYFIQNELSLFYLGLLILIIFTHRENIRLLLSGEETKTL